MVFSAAEPREEAESLIPSRKSFEMTETSRDPQEQHYPIQTHRNVLAKRREMLRKAVFIAACTVAVYCSFRMIYHSMTQGSDNYHPGSSLSKIPQYFDPNPELWPGPTATGRAPFLAQESVVPSLGQAPNKSMERLWGHLSPYSPNYEGWGVEEFPLPEGSQIVQVHVGHRF